jgi:hypothetical protein
MQRIHLILAAALLVPGAALLTSPGTAGIVHAEEESAAERVARLMPDLLAENAEVRDRAERQILALGAAGRAEMERLARDTDPAKVRIAERLLASRAWTDVRPGEQRVRREGEAPADDVPSAMEERLRRLREQTESQLAEFEKRMRELQRSVAERLGERSGTDPQTKIVKQNGRWTDGKSTFAWEIDEDGRVRITTKEGDAPERTFEAESVEKLHEQHPELVKKLEEHATGIRVGGPGWRWPSLPDLPEIPAWKDFGEHFPDLIRRLERDEEGRFHLRAEDATPEDADTPRLGITVEPVPDVLRDQLDLPGLRDAGLVVRDVAESSLAARLGLRRNDVLLRVGSHQIRSASDVRAALIASGQDPQTATAPVTVEIVRRGRIEKLSAPRTETPK